MPRQPTACIRRAQSDWPAECRWAGGQQDTHAGGALLGSKVGGNDLRAAGHDHARAQTVDNAHNQAHGVAADKGHQRRADAAQQGGDNQNVLGLSLSAMMPPGNLRDAIARKESGHVQAGLGGVDGKLLHYGAHQRRPGKAAEERKGEGECGRHQRQPAIAAFVRSAHLEKSLLAKLTLGSESTVF